MAASQLAVAAAQAVIRTHRPNLADGRPFLIDGRWGTTTNSQYSALNPIQQEQVKATLIAAKSSIDEVQRDLAARKVREAANGIDGDWIAADKLEALVRRAAAEQNLTEIADALVGFAQLEPAKKVVNGTTYFNVRSQNGSSRGLFQLQPAAWADARKRVDLPAYSDGVFDPYQNTRAMVAYVDYLINAPKVGFKAKGWPITGDTLYAAYNQGLGGLARAVRGGGMEGNQSRAAKDKVAKAASLLR